MARQPPDQRPDDLVDDDPLVVELSLDETKVATVRVSGELDLATVDQLRDVIARAVAVGVEQIVFDLADITFMDSSGITVLLEAVARRESVLVRSPSIAARRIIETTGLADILRIER